MTTHTLEWIDLLKLYRNADIVVLALTKSLVTSGVTTLLEAMACARPVIVTRTNGLVDYLKPSETVITVEPGDLGGLRKTIQYALENTEVAAATAQEGYRFVQAFHNSDKYVEMLAQLLLNLS
jgi:glycosyltransferase involved in cell wall biosynthesis